jgi:hypothetical protein
LFGDLGGWVPLKIFGKSKHLITMSSFRLEEFDDLRGPIKALEDQRSPCINDRCRRNDLGTGKDVSFRNPTPLGSPVVSDVSMMNRESPLVKMEDEKNPFLINLNTTSCGSQQ